jgi:hypothetical protein
LLSDNLPSGGTKHIGCAYVLNGQLTFLGACLANEIMSSTRIKENDGGVPI